MLAVSLDGERFDSSHIEIDITPEPFLVDIQPRVVSATESQDLQLIFENARAPSFGNATLHCMFHFPLASLLPPMRTPALWIADDIVECPTPAVGRSVVSDSIDVVVTSGTSEVVISRVRQDSIDTDMLNIQFLDALTPVLSVSSACTGEECDVSLRVATAEGG